MDGMERVEPHEAGLQVARGPIDDPFQVFEIAAAPVAAGAHAEEADGEPRQFAAAAQVRVRPGPFGGDDVAGGGAGAGQLHRDIVVAERQRQLQARQFSHPGCAIHLDRANLFEAEQADLKFAHRAVLVPHRNGRGFSQQFGRNIQREFGLGGYTGDDGGGRQALPFPAGLGRQGEFQFLRVSRGHAHGAEEGLLDRGRRRVVVAPDIPEARIDSVQRSGSVEKFVEVSG